MAFQGHPGPQPPQPVYYIGMQPANNVVYPYPDAYGSAAPPPYDMPLAPAFTPAPGPALGCPPGLEYLTQIDQILVHQKVDLAEMIIGWEMSNSYIVKNSLGQQIFTATEENDVWTLQACGPQRPFTIHLHDNMGREVLTLKRPLNCDCCCCPCCLQELEVHSPPGTPIGYVEQNWHPLLPKFTVLNELKQPQLRVKGPFCDCSCMSDVAFQVMSLDETVVVGQISKQWGGFMQEGFTDADNFGISFPMDLDVKMKAVMLAACFLIDFMFFENNPKKDH